MESITYWWGHKLEDSEKKQRFRAWFNSQWSRWDAETGKRTTQQELANHLGIKRSSVAQYVRGTQLPEGDTIRRISQKFGGEIYDILGVPRDLPDLALRASSALDEIRITLEKNGISLDSPEADKITIEIMERWGFKYTGTATDES